MSQELGGGGSIPIGNTDPIEIPLSEAPEKQLKQDEKIPLPPLYNTSGGIVESFKVLSSIYDGLPGYLDSKINTSQFNILNHEINLIGFGGLTTDELTEGAGNLYFTEDNFDTFFALKNTDQLDEGLTNLYYSSARFTDDFNSKTTDDLLEGIDNKYVTSALSQEIADNTISRHSHVNKSLLDSYTQSNSAIGNAVALAHDHSNKAILDATEESFTASLKIKYDSYESGSISSVVAPLLLNSGVLSHSTSDGSKHVPSNSGASQYDVLCSNAAIGSYSWFPIENIIANSTILEEQPSSATDKGVQSNWIDQHNNNLISNVRHLSEAQLSYLETDVPNHIVSTILHVPEFTAADNGKFLFIDSNTDLAWSSSSIGITVEGETYLSATGSVITAEKIDLSQTNISEGSNISISGNQISSIQRAISSSSTDSDTGTAISAGWAYTHEGSTGAGAHIPTGGTVDQYIAGDGSVKSFTDAPGQTYKIILGSGANGTVAERLASPDTIFPTGFSGSVGSVTTDLDISHDTARGAINANIFSDDGTDITKLIGTAAFTTIIGNQASDNVRIVSLATVTEKIYVYLQFE